MPSSSVLDVAIGLAFIYLFLSLICSKVQEWLATWFQNRPRLLRESIECLIGKDLSHQLYKDPFIQQLKSPVETTRGKLQKDDVGRLGADRRDPSYIDPPTFVLALLRVLVAAYPSTPAAALAPIAPPVALGGGAPPPVALAPADGPPTFLSYRQAIVTAHQDAEAAAVAMGAVPKKAEGDSFLEKSHVLSVILTLMDEVSSTTTFSATGPSATVTADLDGAKKRLGDWYNNAMNRTTGAYKRQVQMRLIVIATFVCLLLNADSLRMAERLWREPLLRAQIVTAAQEAVSRTASPAPSPSPAGTPAPAPAGQPPLNTPSPAGQPPPPAAHPNSSSPPAPAPTKSQGGTASGTVPDTATGTTPNPAPNPSPPVLPSDAADKILAKGNTLPLPLGWNVNFPSLLKNPPPDLFTRTFWKLVGLLVTVIALSLGAPFWFDTLNRLVDLRAAGPRPDSTGKTNPKTTP